MSVIVPCRNEAKFIAQCLDSIAQNDYPADRLEILVVDGMSEDGTWTIVREFAKKYPVVRVLRNARKITPTALNLAIKNATGGIILRVDAHARVERDYIRLCVEALQKYRADNVGGTLKTVPREDGLVATAIAASLRHRFGVGNSDFRVGTRDVIPTDTVFGGCYWKEVFDRIGLFNERLPRSQDMEFNQRLRKAGGRILLEPRIKSYYYPSPDLKSFWRHNFHDGVWAVLPLAYSDVFPVRWRHVAPLGFVTAIFGSAVLGLKFTPFRLLLGAIVGAYLLASLVSSAHVAWRARRLSFLCTMPIVFGIRHFGYGLGSLWGAIRLAGAAPLWRKLFRFEAGVNKC